MCLVYARQDPTTKNILQTKIEMETNKKTVQTAIVHILI